MVSHSRAPLGARTLRALNGPARLAVQADAALQPLAVQRTTWPRARTVDHIQDSWRIDDEWWRDSPISRHYFTLLLHDGTLLTLYHDLIADAWFEQRS